MGTWGVGAFDNDAAADWALTLESANDLTLVQRELEAVLQAGDDYLEADQACYALAACEVVARLKGNWGQRDAYSEPADRWVAAYLAADPAPLPPRLIKDALSAVDRILRPPSELLSLWQEADAKDWLSAVRDLRSRVAS